MSRNKYLIGAAVLTALLVASQKIGAKTSEAQPTIILNEQNTVNFRGEVSDSSVLAVESRVLELNTLRGDADYPIYIVLDSPGGSVDSGLDLIRFLKPYKNIHTITIFAASMASAIVEALPGSRYMAESGVIMFHRAKGGFQGQFEDGEVESRLQLAKDTIRQMEQTNADRVGISLTEYKKLVKDEWWLFGKKAVTDNAVDMIVQISCTDGLIHSTDTTALEVAGFGMTFAFSKCPLLRNGMPANQSSSTAYEKLKEKVDEKFTKQTIRKVK